MAGEAVAKEKLLLAFDEAKKRWNILLDVHLLSRDMGQIKYELGML